MSPTLIVCPRCSTQLQSFERTRLVQCGRCGATLVVSRNEQETPVSQAVTSVSSTRTDIHTPPAGNPPVETRAPVSQGGDEKPSLSPPSRRAYLLGLTIAGVVLVVSSVLAVVLAIFWKTDKLETVSVGENAVLESQLRRTKSPARLPRRVGVDPMRPIVLPLLTVLPKEEQEDVNKAIDDGVAFLKKQIAEKYLDHPRYPGEVPLIGLTLLECGVPASDPAVQQITQRVRQGIAGLNATYTLALDILFLDRLGEPADRSLIQRLAFRLLAGQNDAGGWTYNCPLLSEKEEHQLMTFLASQSPPAVVRSVSLARSPGERVRNVPPIPRETLPPSLQGLSVVRYQSGKKPNLQSGGDDNSNTQFAILGVWAARRYEVAVDRSLALIASRFRDSQNSNGSWGYYVHGAVRPDSMTCAGLLGLAVGRVNTADGKHETVASDPAIEKGLKFLGNKIGKPESVIRKRGQGGRIGAGADSNGDLYWLWSMERVGVIYNLKTIGGKDWYTWSTRLIVNHQQKDGSWNDYHGPLVDTCFALLVLKRVNVATDLTQQLNLIGPVRDPGARGEK